MYDSQLLGQTVYVKKEMIKYLIDKCDKISFLISAENIDISQLNCVPVKPRISRDFWNMKGCIDKTRVSRDFWSMKGRIVYFAKTKKIIKFFSTISNIEDFIQIDDIILENLTLYKDDEIIFSICTHEGDIYFNGNIREDIKKHYILMVQNDNDYIFTKNRYLQLKNSNQYINKEVEILGDLDNYVAESKNMIIYQNPKYKCNEEYFKSLVKKYMPQYMYDYVQHLKTFKNFDLFERYVKKSFYHIVYYYLNIKEFFC